MRSRKFWLFALAVAAVWVALEFAVPPGRLDPVILFGIGIACTFASAGMMFVRRDWTARALGVFGVFLGTGLLFLTFYAGWRMRDRQAEYNAIRALLIVGGVLFNAGVGRWMLAYGLGVRAERDADGTVIPRRRKNDWPTEHGATNAGERRP